MTRLAPALLLPLLCLAPLQLAGPQSPAPAAEAPPVEVRVTDAKGRPLEGVRWWVSGYEVLQDGQWVVTQFLGLAKVSTTGPDGRIAIPGKVGMRYDVDLDADGYSPAFLQRLEAGAHASVALERGETVSGRVVQRVDGREVPLLAAVVELQHPNDRGLWFTSQRVTGLDGRFEFDGFLAPAGAAGGEGWNLTCSGASLELERGGPGPIDDLRVEISITRGGR